MKYMAGIYWQTANGEPVSKAEEILLSAVAQTVFVPLYNKVINIVNPWYEVWNHMFDELHPGVDGNSKAYQDYIADRTNEVIKDHNQSNGVVIKYEIIETEDYVYEFVGHFMSYRCFIRLKPA